jgi:hypothetical protein
VKNKKAEKLKKILKVTKRGNYGKHDRKSNDRDFFRLCLTVLLVGGASR